eukprot:GILJ01001182.1.p1 GENE.GILJ01001182.1~~GILJ01001182.1.p1  ORF type:complete len:307 (-),score=45.41 GILJ01001182.1:165-1010(-)
MAARYPYMTCPGNHEQTYNFTHYINRFVMPRTDKMQMHYSFNMGNVHVISISTEVFFYDSVKEQIKIQYEWLEKDLIEATSPENRAQRPWILVIGHRPMYCSSLNDDECTEYYNVLRNGIEEDGELKYGLEDILFKYGVDIEFWAHEHTYERLWPVYNHQVLVSSWQEPYRNPKAPLHIIGGSAGCDENPPHEKINGPRGVWSAYRSIAYGYGRMTFANNTHMYYEQVDSDSMEIIDSLWLIRDEHGPFGAPAQTKNPSYDRRVAALYANQNRLRKAVAYI